MSISFANQRTLTLNDYYSGIRLCSLCGHVQFLKTFTFVLIIVSFVSSLSAFNVDSVTALIQRGPSGTHFGFSVSQHRDRGVSW